MTEQFELTYAPLRAEEGAALDALIAQALFFQTNEMAEWRERLGTQHFRALHAEGKLAAGLGIIPTGQWFGGASVPMAGITAVGVAPEFRGAGMGLALMRRALFELRERGFALSALYPATLTFYRRAGYERAATRTIYAIAPGAIGIRDYELDLAAVAPDHPDIRALYTERARRSAGHLDRDDFLWDHLLRHANANVHAYLATRGGQPEGYVLFRQTNRQEPLAVRDICALTPGAGRRLLTLLADHRTMVEKLLWSGAPNDGLTYLLPEHKHSVHWQLDLVVRVVDVAQALAARGYPPGLSGELHFEVHDELLPWNHGRFVLELADGRGQVRAGGAGRVRLHARALAPLYSGYLTPAELRGLGALEGADADLVFALLAFAGPRPWTPDMF
jgi:predicted acetyltransferase